MASDYEKKMIGMQFQLKENQQYLTDAFKDLENWSSDMKVKEEKLINESVNTETDKVRGGKICFRFLFDKNINFKYLPPVRALATSKKKKKVKKNNDKIKENGQKIKAYDYRKWDKFDVVRFNLYY
jgi:hypothetical protein